MNRYQSLSQLCNPLTVFSIVCIKKIKGRILGSHGRNYLLKSTFLNGQKIELTFVYFLKGIVMNTQSKKLQGLGHEAVIVKLLEMYNIVYTVRCMLVKYVCLYLFVCLCEGILSVKDATTID